jgi:hypothetical protein
MQQAAEFHNKPEQHLFELLLRPLDTLDFSLPVAQHPNWDAESLAHWLGHLEWNKDLTTYGINLRIALHSYLTRYETLRRDAAAKAPKPEHWYESDEEQAARLRSELRRARRQGKPDPRFTRDADGESAVQEVTGNEKLWNLYVDPTKKGAVTFKRPNPVWLKKAKPGALHYVVWADGGKTGESPKKAKLLVKLGVWSTGPLPGIRSCETVE